MGGRFCIRIRELIRTNWVMDKSIEGHLARIQQHLATGRNVLRSLKEGELRTYDIPDVTPDRSVLELEPPRDDDKFYLATDERSPPDLTYLTTHNALLASSLLTIEDRRLFGWPLMLTDVLGLVEQAVLARGSFFYAHALSSYAGGTINIRALEGLDPRTAVVD
jgi:hypothetical protein